MPYQRAAPGTIVLWGNVPRADAPSILAALSMPRRSAIETASASDGTLSFCIMAWRCALMVRSEVPSSWAICLLSLPRTTRANTWLSRGVSVARARASGQAGRAARALLVARQRALDGVDQRFLRNRLRQEVLGAGLDGPDARRNIAMAGQEDDRQDCPSRAGLAIPGRSRPGIRTSSRMHPGAMPGGFSSS